MLISLLDCWFCCVWRPLDLSCFGQYRYCMQFTNRVVCLLFCLCCMFYRVGKVFVECILLIFVECYSLTLCLICSGYNLQALCILPVGIWYLQNDVDTCCVCSMWVSLHLQSNISFFCEFYPVCFLVVSVWAFSLVIFVDKVVIIGTWSVDGGDVSL